MKKTAKSLVEEAMVQVTTYTVEQARALHGHPGVQFVPLEGAPALTVRESTGFQSKSSRKLFRSARSNR